MFFRFISWLFVRQPELTVTEHKRQSWARFAKKESV
jgi:hypothetical protein